MHTISLSPRFRRAAWAVHWLIRVLICVMVLPYGAAKIVLMQMGTMDYPQLLITLGEKSPMGLLWTFMGYSPVVQFLSGAVELLAGVLVLWRRTAWLGGLIGAVSLGVVWLLNMTYDIPVKGLSGLQTVLFLLVLAPWLPRLGRFLAGKPAEAVNLPRVIASERVHRWTRWFPAVATAAIVVAAGIGCVQVLPPIAHPKDTELAGLYEVTRDTESPAPQLNDDRRWHYLAFGRGEKPLVSLRRANGELQFGNYQLRGDTITLELSVPMADDETNAGQQDVAETIELHWRRGGDGSLVLTGPGSHELTLRDYQMGTLLVDREFSWSHGPLNR